MTGSRARWLAVLALCCAASLPALAAGEHNWLTIVGDAVRTDIDTIQVDVKPVAIKANIRLMNLRLSRAKERINGDGIPFRSFEAIVEFDCLNNTARYTRTQFFARPLWTAPTRLMNFPSNDVRAMAFREIEPNPNDRIIRAACDFDDVSSAKRPASSPKK